MITSYGEAAPWIEEKLHGKCCNGESRNSGELSLVVKINDEFARAIRKLQYYFSAWMLLLVNADMEQIRPIFASNKPFTAIGVWYYSDAIEHIFLWFAIFLGI